MGTNKNLFIFLGLAVVALVATVMSGAFNMSEEPDFAQQMINQRGGEAVETPAPVADPTPVPSSPTPSATPSAGDTLGVTDSQGESGAVAGGQLEDSSAGEPESGLEAASQAGETGELTASESIDGTPGDMFSPEGDEGELGLASVDTAASDEDLFLDDAELDDPIGRFKDMDPRDIIDAKYDDLKSRTTTPWDEDFPDEFIPRTGRPDPLTRIRDAIPDELMPQRDEPTDDSLIQLYAASWEATRIVEGMSRSLRCYNVLQIGLQKFASFGTAGGGGQFTVQVGSGQQYPFFIEGVRGIVSMRVTSISTDLVIVNYTASADGLDLGISKTQHFIPMRGY